ncbi:type I-F CRISPR-associated protein Csy1 [Lelliottia wanjuensis]|uniref:Type I-F CRISPR-associated protein Csy1 n=1 Tax=Lelliottia wanjuensis TaxID=3050585 RepID=A0AAP4FVN8_9ENTR|nr:MULTISPECIES: type I-F CRISPR-associated protein Csy1 [unclassified Lelliottia]MDK9363034.1 type I-F CRISPR-associated protein Csy1 [Lelliottia sp. V106_12]MDK9586210.1 type I-F CRISPR-associated protein Csy1 [Lelliottia sp. V86_10]MDK9616481.1 type I-F CRISPR-associated protein Csy1 [Lelliottia sp. V106_9]
MDDRSLAAFIAEYIAGRRQTKLDAFEKEAAKRSAEDSATLAEERRELERRYEPKAWLTDAAKRAGQISLVTHAAKFTHGDSKSSSIYSEAVAAEGYLSSAALQGLEPDAVGNAAALDVAKLLQARIEGDSLLDCLKRGDHRPFAAFTDDGTQLNEWISGFSRALTAAEPASHKLAKQNYFPVNGDYHLLSPLFATSFVHALHQKMIALRFGDEVKAIWKARREKTWHPQPLVRFPDAAETHFGGTKPQNISYLNSVRGGRTWLLSAQPPQWKRAEKPPVNMHSLFAFGGQFDRRARGTVTLLVSLLSRTGKYTNHRIRGAREEYIEALIDLLFLVATEIQREAWQGWTLNCPELKTHQQLWLDPWRTKTDEAFRLEREKDDWQASVAEDFALWLNARLRKALPEVGAGEKREWETRQHLRDNLRELEKIIQEELK